MKLTVYYILSDLENTGQAVELFPTRAALDARLAEIMRSCIQASQPLDNDTDVESAAAVEALIQQGQIDEAWAIFYEDDGHMAGPSLRSADDYWSYDHHELDFPDVVTPLEAIYREGLEMVIRTRSEFSFGIARDALAGKHTLPPEHRTQPHEKTHPPV